MAGPLLQAGLAAGTSLIGGITGNRAQRKAANDQFRYQDALNDNAFRQQRVLQDEQNRSINETNDRVAIWNRDILENHSTSVTNRTSEDTSTGSIDFGRFVRDAEAAGINPLEAMRNGGLAGYSTTNSRNVFNETFKPARDLMTFFGHGEIPLAPSAGNAPTVQASNPIGDALASGFNAWSSFDRNADTRAALEAELARAQIANLNSDTGVNNRRFSIPSWTDTGLRVSAGGFGGATRSKLPNAADILGGTAKAEVGKVNVTNPWPIGNVASWLRDAAASEERYGELLSNAAGAINLIGDGYTLVNQGTKWADHNSGGYGAAAGNALKGYGSAARNALSTLWNNPSWNAK